MTQRVSQDPRVFPRATAADFRAPSTPKASAEISAKALFDDWSRATVRALATQRANQRVSQQIAQWANASGFELTEETCKELFAQNRPLREKLSRQYLRALDANDSTREQAIKDSLAEARQRLSAPDRRNPFAALIAGDPDARAQERIVYENAHVLVLEDSFADSPKVLVVPKKPGMFPTDMQNQLPEVARAADAAAEAFATLFGIDAPAVWINPPQRVSVPQLHVHVLPRLPDWGDDPKAVAAAKRRLFRTLARELQQTMA